MSEPVTTPLPLDEKTPLPLTPQAGEYPMPHIPAPRVVNNFGEDCIGIAVDNGPRNVRYHIEGRGRAGHWMQVGTWNFLAKKGAK